MRLCIHGILYSDLLSGRPNTMLSYKRHICKEHCTHFYKIGNKFFL